MTNQHSHSISLMIRHQIMSKMM